MSPQEIIAVAKRLSWCKPIEGSRRQITVCAQDWDDLSKYLAQLEPITEWPMPEREPPTHLVVHGIPVVIG